MVYICPGGNCTGIAIFFLTKCHIWNTLVYTVSTQTPKEKRGFTLACLAHSRPAAPTWRACQAWPARCCLVSATKLAAPGKKTDWGLNSKMKIICKLPARSVELYRHCPGGLCWLLSSRASTCGKSVSHSCSWVIFNLWNLFSKRSRASSTRSESARVPCQAMMFLNSLKADLETGVSFVPTAIT